MKSLSLLLACLSISASFGFSAQANKPNIVRIVADHLGYADAMFNAA